MDKEKQIKEMRKDLIEIFDEEFEKQRIITADFTAIKMTAKGYRKASEVAREIFEEIEASAKVKYWRGGGLVVFEVNGEDFAELKKKYTESEDTNESLTETVI